MNFISALILIIFLILICIGLLKLYILIIKGIINFIKNKIIGNNNKEKTINNTYEEKYNQNKEYVINYYKNTNTNVTETISEEDYKKYYRPKIYLITLNELVFYNVLIEIAKELDLMLCSQVSLYNIINTKKGLDESTRTIYFNKIAQKSIDFVLVDKKDLRIRLCIELDDSTHKKYKRIKRDNFINKLFKDLNINLLRCPAKFHYNKEELKNKILENLNINYYEKERYL